MKYYKSNLDGGDWWFKTKSYFKIDFDKKENEMIFVIYEKIYKKTKIIKWITKRKDFNSEEEITKEEYLLIFNKIKNE